MSFRQSNEDVQAYAKRWHDKHKSEMYISDLKKKLDRARFEILNIKLLSTKK